MIYGNTIRRPGCGHGWGGSEVVPESGSQAGVYGTPGTPAPTNGPGGRDGALGWVGKSGALWLFGGYSPDYPLGPGLYQNLGLFNDLWTYQTSGGDAPAAASPTFSLNSGAYPAGEVLTLSDATPSATITYFVSGSTSPMAYTEPLVLGANESIQAIAEAPGYRKSTVASATYTVPVTSAPTFNVAPGTYPSTQSVALASGSPGATIYYAINNVPTTDSTVYDGPIAVTSSETVEAMAVASGAGASAVSTATYTIWPASAVNQWAWMGGADTNEFARGIYGAIGTAAASNFPGAHMFSATWKDNSGKLWLFGGIGVDGNGSFNSFMNDLWSFDPATRQWTWMGGSKVVGEPFSIVGSTNQCALGGCGQPGSYGTLGIAAVTNSPGGREAAANWTDAHGNFWLFGGYGFDSAGTLVYLNDLWKYDPSIQEWTWMGGPSTVTGTCFGNEGEGFYCGGEQSIYGSAGDTCRDEPARGTRPGDDLD